MRCIACDTEIQDPNVDVCPGCHAVLSSPTEPGEIDPGPALAALTRDRTARATRLPSGTIISDRYRIVRHLGSGGMGVVYQADDLKLNVPVALKFLSQGDGASQRRLELFINEVRLARQITHPNVCRIFDVGEIDGRHFLSMEHVEGEDLASLLRRIGRLPTERALTIALEICRGLEAAHERGILHGDLKPSNLMIDLDGRAKIMDFGLANFCRHGGLRNEVAGTPDYMAPEQHRGESSVQTEIYALGLLLYELFTGRRARHDLVWAGDSPGGLAVTATLADLDPIVERVILHCLERDPGLRPSSVAAVSAALARLLAPPWRPREGAAIPHRKHWVLQRQLGQGGFGETWVAEHAKTHDRRVFKFCNNVAKLSAFHREITLFRFMRETLGGRDDIVPLVDWQLDEPPYFIESEFSGSVNLAEWLRQEGGITSVPVGDRVEVIRRVAIGLSAAHSVGVLHKDVKPANVLVGRGADGAVRARLCDFGISVLTDKARLQAAGVTAAGLTTDAHGAPSPDAGTRLYMAPEILEGKPPTTSADVYALGVMLYQMIVGDLSRALAPGWDRDITDDLLREDVASAVDGTPERRLSAPQLAERLGLLRERSQARDAEERIRKRARLVQQAAQRRRKWATAVLAALLLLGVGLGLAFERAESSAREALIDQTLRSNEAMVRLAGAAISDKLEDAMRRVNEHASDPLLRDLLDRIVGGRDQRSRSVLDAALQQHLDRVLIREEPRIQIWAVADNEAWVRARAPYDPVVIGQNYKYREWFNGRQELPNDAQVPATPRTSTGFSLAYRSTAQGRPLMIGVASPVFGGTGVGSGRILGVLIAGIHLQAFNGWLEVAENRPHDGECPDRFVLLLHRAQLIRHPCQDPASTPLPVEAFMDEPSVESLLEAPGRRTANFRDPLRSSGRGPALGVAASLDRLPDWTLILEQDVEVALKPITALTADFHGPAHLAFGLGLAAFVPLVALLWWGGRWRMRSRSANQPAEIEHAPIPIP